jgi:hypothetical protein
MLNGSEPPITLAELIELQELESSARSETRDDANRFLRMRLDGLRAGKADRMHSDRSRHLATETRIAALEVEVARLRALLEGRA